MAYLDSSGDIILDCVLTDEGRRRLSQGFGAFKVVKWGLSDDEINYALYDADHASGSAYYDLAVLQLPILEAFTNNAASMKCRLMSIPRTNILYLPIFVLNDVQNSRQRYSGGGISEIYLVAVDEDSQEALISTTGVLAGYDPRKGTSYIRVDQGLMTQEPTYKKDLDSDLVETQFIVEMDHRLGYVYPAATENMLGTAAGAAKPSYVDDDNIASYYLSRGTDMAYIADINDKVNATSGNVITGPRGTKILFKIQSSLSLQSDSVYWFTRLGGGNTMTISATNYYYIDSVIRVTGATTGASVDIPVRYVKQV
jgi:hypothetical protein